MLSRSLSVVIAAAACASPRTDRSPRLRYVPLHAEEPGPADEAAATMVWETVQLTHLPPATVAVRAELVFRGELPRTLAFPESEWFALRDFRVVADGEELAVEHLRAEPGGHLRLGLGTYSGIYTFRPPRTPGDEHRQLITYSYTAPFYSPGTKATGPSGLYVEYVLTTGATWRGAIGAVEVTFDTRPVPCPQLVVVDDGYAGECVGPWRWRFVAEELEPTREVRLLLPLAQLPPRPALPWSTPSSTASRSHTAGRRYFLPPRLFASASPRVLLNPACSSSGAW